MSKLVEKLVEIESFTKKNMTKDILHGWPHIRRVLKYAQLVNEEMKGDWNIIKSAILLHDVGHAKKRINHNEIGAKIAEKFLISIKINKEAINLIKASILTHSRQFAKEKPSSIEAKVVYDADGMDLFGSIGLMRALLSCGLRNKEFECMIKKIEWRISEKGNFYSKTAMDFAFNNSKIIKIYLLELKKQISLLNKGN